LAAAALVAVMLPLRLLLWAERMGVVEAPSYLRLVLLLLLAAALHLVLFSF
jgi:hypothetical protein